MASLSAKERRALPDSAFAYIDAEGNRRLPINDAPHVRAALSRFGQVAFEDDDARDRARARLLRAAKKHGIMPIGFINAQLQPQLRLPTGQVTFLLTDIEGSTGLLNRLGDEYASLLANVRRVVRGAIRSTGGTEVSARGDDHFVVFERAPDALQGALAIQRAMPAAEWPGDTDVRLRIGLHRGRPQLTETGYVGISVHAAARICFAAHGGQIVLSSAVRSALEEPLPGDTALRELGAWRFRGLPEPLTMFEVQAPDLDTTSHRCARRRRRTREHGGPRGDRRRLGGHLAVLPRDRARRRDLRVRPRDHGVRCPRDVDGRPARRDLRRGGRREVIGSANAYANRPGAGSHVASASFMVDPARAGRGAGSALGEAVLDWATAAGFDSIQFNAVVETNERAVGLWRSLGFEVIGTVPEAFRLPDGTLTGLHVMYRRLG